MSGASERANGRVSGPLLQSVFFAVIDHSAVKVLLITLVIEDRAVQLSKVGRKVYLGLFDFLSILKPLDVRNGESMNLALKDKLLVMLSLRIFQWNLHGWWH